jgi:hypothetical protein
MGVFPGRLVEVAVLFYSYGQLKYDTLIAGSYLAHPLAIQDESLLVRDTFQPNLARINLVPSRHHSPCRI